MRNKLGMTPCPLCGNLADLFQDPDLSLSVSHDDKITCNPGKIDFPYVLRNRKDSEKLWDAYEIPDGMVVVGAILNLQSGDFSQILEYSN